MSTTNTSNFAVYVDSSDFSRLQLVVKYGADVTVVEAQTQVAVHKQLQGHVPILKVFGWTEVGDQTFIYMSLIEGKTLEERWSHLNKTRGRPGGIPRTGSIARRDA